jgi:hypothetical protein
MKSITVTLGDRNFEVKELTIGQVEQIHEVLAGAKESNHTRASTNRQIIAAALAVDTPDVTAEALKGFRVRNIQDLGRAADAILEFGGWVIPETSAKDAADSGEKPGEAAAG